MLKSVEQQKLELEEIRDTLNLNLGTVNEELKQIEKARDALKAECQSLQNQFAKK